MIHLTLTRVIADGGSAKSEEFIKKESPTENY